MLFKKNTKKENTFIKEASPSHLDKNALITKAYTFLSQGNIEKAHILFKEINLYEGLMKVSKAYYDRGQIIEAYTAAKQAGNKKDFSKMKESIAKAITLFINNTNKKEYIQPEKENRIAILTEFIKNKRKKNSKNIVS